MKYILFLFSFSIGTAQVNIDTASFTNVLQGLNFEQNNFVVIGEAHTIKNTFAAELLIIKNLLEKGYKKIYIEGGESEAIIINMFLNSGDTSLLVNTRAREKSGTYKAFLQSIYKLNKEKNLNLVFKGFDFERVPCIHYLFSNWFNNVAIENNELKAQIDLLLSIKEPEGKQKGGVDVQNKKIKEVFENARIYFQQNEGAYQAILKENFSNFKNILFNPVFSDFSKRDKQMEELALKNEKQEGLDKSIIIIGSQHMLNKSGVIPALIKGVSEKYSITGFVFVYSNCRFTEGERIYSSDKKLLNYLPKAKPDKQQINFTLTQQQIIPTETKNVSTIITALYNQ